MLSRQTAGVRPRSTPSGRSRSRSRCGLAALLFARGAGGRIRWTLEQAGGFGRIRLGRVLGVAGICVALSASIAVGFYELLLRLEG